MARFSLFNRSPTQKCIPLNYCFFNRESFDILSYSRLDSWKSSPIPFPKESNGFISSFYTKPRNHWSGICGKENIVLSSIKNKHLLFVRNYVPSEVCWNCNKTLKTSTIFCETCNSLQPVNKKSDYFHMLGLNHNFRLNSSKLKERYKNLQTLLHPDKFSSKSKKEQELSEEFSSAVNKAYSTLLNPLERGLYLLGLNSISIEEGNTDVDKVFLMEIMERNEEIENEINPKKLKDLYSNNREKLDQLIEKTAEAFDLNDLKLAKKLLTEMKYYNSIEVKIKELKQKLNIPD